MSAPGQGEPRLRASDMGAACVKRRAATTTSNSAARCGVAAHHHCQHPQLCDAIVRTGRGRSCFHTPWAQTRRLAPKAEGRCEAWRTVPPARAPRRLSGKGPPSLATGAAAVRCARPEYGWPAPETGQPPALRRVALRTAWPPRCSAPDAVMRTGWDGVSATLAVLRARKCLRAPRTAPITPPRRGPRTAVEYLRCRPTRPTP